ncbi:RluA family pseudouridine synthase [bacterium endosymbiont of Bathymodiolus sp. 5 South]|jgi:23S rRNA pseudouridine955/2504/2580 synthase|uniref:RluA family pseudouridine synthase n=1 Tax=bacterium endosymbiont of Bathymodiolus sp. 5 South TaxID=1181670 RepID=UPI0010B0D79D|nr:RluA family pseudouridine synthase [bacterium endosymbiont of Bathymodiolus sp. 5 South]CAC9638809.1 Ribosomal large subunit pseudouridine synthase C (EC 5.4.99.24) [uncultured Gammaproteobacteria bacterium]CAC9639313.1 Ribosomal large subunit pseudouridine synthase C (EC 5.4.99.24) [uncultured Gammaproteobacteria bacterium]SHN90465.1 Ribosomal large subunit pseudouridine synthase C [bacterium endosymbiont of Bathymodiolus sp. 5 South]VVH55368.1 Ribosomal large subunit pseudouridine synthase
MSVQFKTVDEFAVGQRLDNYLLKHLKGVPKSHIYRVIRKGEVRVNKGRKKADYKLQIDDVVRIPPIRVAESKPSKTSDSLKKLLTESILYEDKGLLVINKPSGLAVHGGSGIDVGVIEALRDMFNTPVELVHRIDRATSGVLLIAKKRSVLKNLHEQLVQHHMEKRYTALVKGTWSKKRHSIDAPLYQNSRCTVVDAKGKEALSHFQPIKNFDSIDASLVEVLIETGRMHQIRVHAQYVGHPLACDDKYGDREFDRKLHAQGLRRLFLHAHQLTFTNPSTGEIQTVKAPLSAELEVFLATL